MTEEADSLMHLLTAFTPLLFCQLIWAVTESHDALSHDEFLFLVIKKK